jgi:hypothetical protein
MWRTENWKVVWAGSISHVVAAAIVGNNENIADRKIFLRYFMVKIPFSE